LSCESGGRGMDDRFGDYLVDMMGSEPFYIRTQPSRVFVLEFDGSQGISDTTLRRCVPELSDRCEIVPEPVSITDFIYQPRIFSDDKEIVNGAPVRTVKDCFWHCVLGSPVSTVAEVGAGAIATGSIPKKWVGISSKILSGGTDRKVSRFTSIPSIIAHKFPSLDSRIRRVTGSVLTGKAPVIDIIRWPPKVYISNARTPLRFIGRWIPGIGWGLLAADVFILDQCIAQCRGQKSLLRTVLEEVLPLPKPAY